MGQYELSVVPLMTSLHHGRLVVFHSVRRLRTFPSSQKARGYALSVWSANHRSFRARSRLASLRFVHLDGLAGLVILLEHNVAEVAG